ncbi:MAG: adenosylcobinamide-GDP ribazoletransferase [Paracoccaceae bacterium]|nr:adenosylcobinamide-GDP ribazoletransferase [Paracoccaceae bacterium]
MQEWLKLRFESIEFDRDSLLAAAGILTVIPIPGVAIPDYRGVAASAWIWPIVGGLIGCLAGIAGTMFSAFGFNSALGAVLVIGLLVLLTGALHEDGLADCVDGLAGGSSPESRLSIMQDSRIGVFGALALMLVLIGRWSAVAELYSGSLTMILIAIGAASRLPMILAMAALPNARSDGLSASVGRPPGGTVLLSTAITLGICALTLGPLAGFSVFIAAIVAAIPICWLARVRVGGQTGDVLGASQQFAEFAALAVAVALCR